MSKLTIVAESLPARCEVCHQTDLFDPVKSHCSRCREVIKPHKTEVLVPSFRVASTLSAILMTTIILIPSSLAMVYRGAFDNFDNKAFDALCKFSLILGSLIGTINGSLALLISNNLKSSIHRLITWTVCGAILGAVIGPFTIFSNSWTMIILVAIKGGFQAALSGFFSGLIFQYLYSIPTDKNKKESGKLHRRPYEQTNDRC